MRILKQISEHGLIRRGHQEITSYAEYRAAAML
jgi:hypothetical protein